MGSCSSARRCRCRRPRPPRALETFTEQRETYSELGEVQPALLAGALRGFPGGLLRRHLQRAALDQADRGRDRVGARHRPGTLIAHDPRAGLDDRRTRFGAGRAQVRCPHPRDPRDRGHDPPSRRGRGAGRAPRRAAGHAGGLGPLPAGARSGQGQPHAARLHPAPARTSAWTRARARPRAGAVHLLADRLGSRAAGRGDRA